MTSVRRTVSTPTASYVVVDADPFETSGLIVARVVDAASGQARTIRRVSTRAPHAYAHVASGGWLVLTGRPQLAVPNLGTANQALPARLEFDDVQPVDLVFTIPAGSTLPFRPPDVDVEPPPTSLVGTVTAEAFPHAPIGGATIAVAATAPPPALVALGTPLAAGHSGTANVVERTLAPAAAATALAAPAQAGATKALLLSVAGCTPGTGVLVLGEPADFEHVRITAVDVAAKEVTLAVPLRRSRPGGAAVRAFLLTGVGSTTTLARAAVAGDGVVLVDAALAGAVVELAGPLPELRATGLVANVDGRWRLDGVRSIGELTLTVSAAGFITLGPVPYDVDYRRPNLIDLSLTT